MLTTVLEVVALGLIVVGGAVLVFGVATISVSLAFIVGGLVAAALGFGGLWISKRVSQ